MIQRHDFSRVPGSAGPRQRPPKFFAQALDVVVLEPDRALAASGWPGLEAEASDRQRPGDRVSMRIMRQIQASAGTLQTPEKRMLAKWQHRLPRLTRIKNPASLRC
jgi:hypothetical protein